MALGRDGRRRNVDQGRTSNHGHHYSRRDAIAATAYYRTPLATGEGFFINCLVCRLTATGAGGAKPDESARQVRTLIATRAIIVARIHAFSGLKNR